MCGIAGFVDPRGGVSDPKRTLVAMADRLAHRGPNDQGLWWDEQRRVGFAHRRLSIIDLSAAGHQPMSSASGRFTLVFNGEIYNANELRSQLDSRSRIDWRGHSDTEVMLAAFEAWGVADAVIAFAGMFACAVFDRELNRLHLLRDRVGKKPLSYGWIRGTFVFASEVTAMRPISGAMLDIDRSALAAFLRHGYVPGPYSIHPTLRKVPPGTIATIDLAALVDGDAPLMEKYWDAAQVARTAARTPSQADDDVHVDQLHAHLERSISRRMISDVPLGAFLSGGVDSALIAAVMSRLSASKIKTFTIGFDDRTFDESSAARTTAQALATDHTEFIATPRDAMNIIPRLSAIYDEPFADSSQIPTMMLSDLARSQVTVALAGDGGDEILGGYDRYFFTSQMWAARNSGRSGPSAMQRFLMRMVLSGPLSGLVGRLLPTLGIQTAGKRTNDKIARFLAIAQASSFEDALRRLACIAVDTDSLVLGAPTAYGLTVDRDGAQDFDGRAMQMMRGDFMSYLPDDLLVKVDRASMSIGLEVRSPFLDHELVEWAWGIPMSAKIRRTRRHAQGKWVSYQLADRIIPGGFSARPKVGFGVPLAKWLRGDLRSWAEDLLDARRITNEGFFDASLVRARWDGFIAGNDADRHLLWAILMFESWLSRQRAE